MRLLAISGSLRGASTNSALMRAALDLSGTEEPATAAIGELPHFNPDLDGEGAIPPAPVAALRAAVAAADAVLIVSPEYAHGMPGVLKNALDWLVSGPDLIGKPVAVLSASPLPVGAPHAQAQLRETLRTMSARVIPEACLEIGFVGRKVDTATATITDPATREHVRAALAALRTATTATGQAA